jgi:hypothetical protein
MTLDDCSTNLILGAQKFNRAWHEVVGDSPGRYPKELDFESYLEGFALFMKLQLNRPAEESDSGPPTE